MDMIKSITDPDAREKTERRFSKWVRVKVVEAYENMLIQCVLLMFVLLPIAGMYWAGFGGLIGGVLAAFVATVIFFGLFLTIADIRQQLVKLNEKTEKQNA